MFYDFVIVFYYNNFVIVFLY